MSLPEAIPDGRLAAVPFVAAIKPTDLLHFVLNVGDGDAQVLLLPAKADGTRDVVIVDIAVAWKVIDLVEQLADTTLLQTAAKPFALLVATHPHADHIGGVAEFIDRYGHMVREFWEPGFFHTSQLFNSMMVAVERASFGHLQPAGGTAKFIGGAKFNVVGPSSALRSRFDTYGVDANNSSITLKVDYPAAGVLADGGVRRYIRLPSKTTMLLGADAQTESWAHAMVDFPSLRGGSDAAKAIRAARGADLLRADVLKVPHHASKHGLSLELVETVKPKLSLVSCAAPPGNYNFPHDVAQAQLREALKPIASDRTGSKFHGDDVDLGVHYTCDVTTAAGDPAAGSICVQIGAGGRRRVWRLMDRVDDAIDLEDAQRFT